MKKKFFMLLAAVLLGSVSAFAQSGNNNPAKGDVNEDGMVDVADINAILKIMKDGGGPVAVGGYFYLGTTEPTAANYKSLPGAVTTFTSIDDAVGTTASVAAGETLYMLCPAAWVTEKNVALEDKSGNTIDFLDEIDAATISGHVIYKTQVWNAPNDVVLKTSKKKYFYIGTTKPTSLEYQGVTTVNEYPAEQLYTNETGSKAYIHVLTNSDKTVNFYDPGDITSPATTDIDTTTIPGYKITSMNFRVSIGGTILIKISDTYYFYVGTTPVDDTNYTSISSSVTEIPASTNVTLNTDDYLYIVAPKTKTVTVLDANTHGIINIKTYNPETHTFTYAETFVDDYKIYKSAQPCVGPFTINISDTNI